MDLVVLLRRCSFSGFVSLGTILRVVTFTLVLVLSLGRESLHQKKPGVLDRHFLARRNVNDNARLNHLLDSHFASLLFGLKNQTRYIDFETFVVQIACNFDFYGNESHA